MTDWLNRHALQYVDGQQALYGFLVSVGLFGLLYLVAHLVDKKKTK